MHAMTRYPLEALGQGKLRSGGVAGRKLRYAVMEIWPSWGVGLPHAQHHGWDWIREAWGENVSGA